MTYLSQAYNRDLWAYIHVNKYSWHPYVAHRHLYNCEWYLILVGQEFLLDGWQYLEPHIHVAIRARVTSRHFLVWMRTVGQLRQAGYRGVFMLLYALYRWTRQIIHNTLIVVDRYLRRMGEPRLESSYPPFVADIDPPHQGAMDSYSVHIHIFRTYFVTRLKCFTRETI